MEDPHREYTMGDQDDKIRAFIAIEIDPRIRRKLAVLKADVPAQDARIKWVAQANIHLTIAFLGDIPATITGALATELDVIASHSHEFTYNVTGIGYFGSLRRPRIIWAGVSADQELLNIHERLTASLDGLGIPIEKRQYNPHLTLGRVRQVRRSESLATTLSPLADKAFGAGTADSVVLFQSELKPGGPEYTVLHRAALTAD